MLVSNDPGKAQFSGLISKSGWRIHARADIPKDDLCSPMEQIWNDDISVSSRRLNFLDDKSLAFNFTDMLGWRDFE
jgi:hypothetical protein